MNHGKQVEPTDGSTINWSVGLSICLPVCWSIYLSIYFLSVSLSISLSIQFVLVIFHLSILAINQSVYFSSIGIIGCSFCSGVCFASRVLGFVAFAPLCAFVSFEWLPSRVPMPKEWQNRLCAPSIFAWNFAKPIVFFSSASGMYILRRIGFVLWLWCLGFLFFKGTCLNVCLHFQKNFR